MGKKESKHTRKESGGDDLVAAFWRQGKFQKFTCSDCQVIVQQNYSEVMLRDSLNNYAMFVITNDPDVTDSMTQAGYEPGVFDGFLLKNLEGQVLERISIHDPQSIN